MSGKYIALIVVLGIWIVLLIAFGILAYLYHLKHQVLVNDRTKYFDEYNKIKDENIVLTPLNLNLSLNENEVAYAYKSKARIYNDGFKRNHKPSKRYAKFDKKTSSSNDDEYYEDLAYQTETGILRWHYSIKGSMNHYDEPDIYGSILVTNARIIFASKTKSKTLFLSEVFKIEPEMVLLDKNFYRGFILSTKEGVFEVEIDDLHMVMIIKTLIKKMKGEKNEE